MTARSTWKNHERTAARFFGAERVMGSGALPGTSSDSDHPSIYIESKLRRQWALWSLFRETERKAQRESKVPVLAIREKGRHGWLLVCRPKDLQRVAGKTDGGGLLDEPVAKQKEHEMSWTEKKNVGSIGPVRVSVTEAPEGALFLNVRKYFETESGEMRPTKQGVMISEGNWQEFLKVVKEAVGKDDE